MKKTKSILLIIIVLMLTPLWFPMFLLRLAWLFSGAFFEIFDSHWSKL